MTLQIEETVNKLRQYQNVSYPILTVYLQIPQKASNRNMRLRDQFDKLVEMYVSQIDAALYQQDLTYIAAFLDTYKHIDHHQGIALFSGDQLWEVITTPNQLPNKLSIQHSPDLKPLLKTLSQYRRFLVVLADRQKARYFTLHMGHVESQGGVEDPSVPQKATGRVQHIRMHLNQHMKFIGGKVNEFVKNKQISAVIIGGHKEILRNLKDNLPQHLQQKIAAEFISELNTSMNIIVTESKKVIEKVNNDLNQKQVLHSL